MFLNGGVHRIGSNIHLSGPHHSTVIKRDLGKQRRVAKRSEYPSFWRVYQAGYIDNPSETVGKYNAQPKPRKGLDFGHAPRRPGCNGYCSGRIFIGI
jgi:hypothetical protein